MPNRPAPQGQRIRYATTRPDVFETLMAPLLPTGYRLAYFLTGSAADAEDLVQEAALRAFRGFHTFQPGSDFRAWFSRILKNVFYESVRQRRREVTDAWGDIDALSPAAASGSTLPAGDNPAERLTRRWTLERVTTAIAGLPEDYRMVSALYFLEDLSYRDISSILGCPVGTVRSRLHRGRKLLRQSLAGVAEDHGMG